MTLRRWRTITGWLRVAAFVAWAWAGVELVRDTGGDDRLPFAAVYSIVTVLWLLAEVVLSVVDRPKPQAKTDSTD